MSRQTPILSLTLRLARSEDYSDGGEYRILFLFLFSLIGISSIFILINANQTHTDISDIPDGRLLQVSSSRLSQDDISAE